MALGTPSGLSVSMLALVTLSLTVLPCGPYAFVKDTKSASIWGDISAAFDRVCRALLLGKLAQLGIPPFYLDFLNFVCYLERGGSQWKVCFPKSLLYVLWCSRAQSLHHRCGTVSSGTSANAWAGAHLR